MAKSTEQRPETHTHSKTTSCSAIVPLAPLRTLRKRVAENLCAEQQQNGASRGAEIHSRARSGAWCLFCGVPCEVSLICKCNRYKNSPRAFSWSLAFILSAIGRSGNTESFDTLRGDSGVFKVEGGGEMLAVVLWSRRGPHCESGNRMRQQQRWPRSLDIIAALFDRSLR